ncbi:glutathione-dependent formaldehyde dehydrogenase, partial [Burkholderia pseudomallei]
AAQCEIEPGDVVAVWGAGAVGLFAAMSARLLGAAEVIAIDRVPERLALAQKLGATPLDFERLGVADTLAERTRGKGPDKCIDAVGLEAQAGEALDAVTDRFRPTVAAGADQPHVLREMIYACRPGGVLSVPGVYGGLVDKLPMGALMHKGLTLRAGQTHVCRWTAGLLERIADGRLDPSCVITHRATLEEGPAMYETFGARRDGCIRPVLRPRH